MRRGRPPYPDLLTPREQEVLSLLREGLTNRQIAERLGISLYGARYHVSEILSKLGVATREEAARWRGERMWGLAGIGALLSRLDRARWEVLMKGTSIVLLGGAAIAIILLAAGVFIALSADSGGASKESEPTTVASNDPEAAPEFDLPPYLEYGPYRIAALDYQGDESTQPSPLARPPEQQGPVASTLEGARASSLFPAIIPDGYELIEASSDGRPSELFLRLVFDGADGPVTVERSRPLEMPIDYRYDPSIFTVQLALLGGGGFASMPRGGDDETPGGYLRIMEDGIDTATYGPQVSVETARDFYREMMGELGVATAERSLPPLNREPGSLPRPEEIALSGPCAIDVIVHPNYVWHGADLQVASWMECSGLVPLAPCEPGSVYQVSGLEVACDAKGYRIDRTWTVNSETGSCASEGPAFVQDGKVVSAQDHCRAGGAGSSGLLPIEVCVTVRDQESCASFDYELP